MGPTQASASGMAEHWAVDLLAVNLFGEPSNDDRTQ